MKEGWQYKNLGEVCTSELGKTLNKAKDTGKLRPYLCSINVLWNTIDLTNVKEAKFEDADYNRFSVKKGDLLICEGGDIGRSAIWKEDYPMLYQNALHRVRFDGTILPLFCLYALKHLKDNGIIDANYGKGVTIKHLVKSSLMSIVIPVPPLAEQERIVAELDLLTEIIDKQKAQLKELDTLAQSIFYDMFGDPVENEKGWAKRLLKDVCTALLAGGDVPKNDFSERKTDVHSVPILSNGVGEKAIYGYTSQAKIFEESITISGRGTIGYCEVRNEPFFPVVRLIVATPNKTIVLPMMLKYIVDSMHLKGIGVAIPQLTIPMVKNLAIIIPPLQLQQEFIHIIQSIEQQKATITQSIAETQKLFDYTMDKYFG